ncbi:MAG: gluconate 2-dehydrogenase subunit 3 family protein [Parvibaculum sp.]|nr:gluconate 2-dehydrogenase subunit 3 family protein [Parvibaculum sp.]
MSTRGLEPDNADVRAVPNRRDFLAWASLAAAGVAVSGSALTVSMPAAADVPKGELRFFTSDQRHMVAILAETIIPRTDTPGAIDAGVPRYIEFMVGEWLTPEERSIFMHGLAAAEKMAMGTFGRAFSACAVDERERILDLMEDEAGAASWYIPGNVDRAFDSAAPFICQLKELTVYGYFSSRMGATQALVLNSAGGDFAGDIPLSDVGSAWAPVFTVSF